MITDARQLVQMLIDSTKVEPINDDMTEAEVEAAMRRVIDEAKSKVRYKKEPMGGWFCDCGSRLINLKGLWICDSCGVVNDPRTSRVN